MNILNLIIFNTIVLVEFIEHHVLCMSVVIYAQIQQGWSVVSATPRKTMTYQQAVFPLSPIQAVKTTLLGLLLLLLPQHDKAILLHGTQYKHCIVIHSTMHNREN